MQSTNQPGKFLIPFAQNDSAKVEIPATSADPTRMSQSLGSPPLTGMPPEAGGVPPQLEDFNGAMNQVARIPWWLSAGARFGFDATWSADPAIGGYPRGAVLPAALGAALVGMGEWYNNTEDNTADPDVSGAGWVPGYHYGSTALTGQTGGTVTLTPAQAAKRVITIAGTLTSNLVLVVPGWVYDWTVYNNTGGAFTVTIKNAATPGVVVPQNGAPTPVRCDGTAVSLLAPNIGPATSAFQAARVDQTYGRLLGVQTFTANGTYTPTPGTRRILVELLAAGGGGGGVGATSSSSMQAGGGGGGGAYVKFLIDVPGAPVSVTIGTGGTGGAATAGASGGTGGNSSFGTLATAGGGGGGPSLTNNTGGAAAIVRGGAPSGTPFAGTVTPLLVTSGARGGVGYLLAGSSSNNNLNGLGGSSFLGCTSQLDPTNPPLANLGIGGCGGVAIPSSPAQAGQAGSAGVCYVWEYA